MDLPGLDLTTIGSDVIRIAVAYLLALPVAWEREQGARSAGLRTFPLVATASCGYVMVGLSVVEGSDALSRILYGLMTGIGFIGGGAILKHHKVVRGTATAASIWNTGAIGAAVAFDRTEIAVVLSVINFLTLRLGGKLKERVHRPAGSPEPPDDPMDTLSQER
ncbi:MAG TPA: MgtC/SapB family protein [Longimicrobiales bacterium]|nr:MgtC/SapB family protein [Longimicrobiales bacterium]